MDTQKLYLLTLTLICCGLRTTSTRFNEITPSCDPNDDICELVPMVIESAQTMMYREQGSTQDYPVVEIDGEFHRKLDCFSGITVELTDEELSSINTGDGSYKYVITVNGEFPGPTYVVYEGQEVRVNVTNLLLQEYIGVHFHGLHQTGTNWMDGVPGVTQCGINPGETFTYRFTASPAGSHWYHSHAGLQRVDGLFGGFIVLPRPEAETSTEEPEYAGDFMMMIHELFPQTADQMFVSYFHGVDAYLFDREDGCRSDPGLMEDGTSAGSYEFNSALINGRGRHYDSTGSPSVLTPHEVYTVSPNNYYKFRVINGAKSFGFKVSIDGHPLMVTHTETDYIVHQYADSLIVTEGERFEFYIYTNSSVENYWIRVETLEEDEPHYTLAVLNYEGVPQDQDPTSTARECTVLNQCTVVNCPYRYLFGSECINVGDLRSQIQYEPSAINNEIIHNYHSTIASEGIGRSSVNGILFVPPTTPPAVLGTTQYDLPCDGVDCVEGVACRCNHQLQFNMQDTIQMTLFSELSSHPMHSHGYKFHVLKVGYPHYTATNRIFNRTDDILCPDNNCNRPEWTDPSWVGGNIPGLNLDNPVSKDTVVIPAGGYVVIRFVVNNPGWWMFHCHKDIHFAQGMGFIVQAGTDEDMIPAPDNFHMCGSTIWQDPQTSMSKKRKASPKEHGIKASDNTMNIEKYNQMLENLNNLYEQLRDEGIKVPKFGETIKEF